MSGNTPDQEASQQLNQLDDDEIQLLKSLDVKIKEEIIEEALAIPAQAADREDINSINHIQTEQGTNQQTLLRIESSQNNKDHDREVKNESEVKPTNTHVKWEEEKSAAILLACLQRDIDALVNLAIEEGGLVNDDVRKVAWPILLGYAPDNGHIDVKTESVEELKNEKLVDWHFLPKHRDEDQVQLDVNRSFVYYPTDMTPEVLAERRTQLQDLIVEVLRRHPMLCYFQGFHDISQVVLLVLGPELAPKAMTHISLLQIRDFMLPSLLPALVHLMLLQPILATIDRKLCDHISVTQPYFALAATITLYAHDIQVYSDVARLFDVFLAEDPSFPVYFFVTIILSRRDELLNIPQDEADVMHAILSRLPKPLNLEFLITRAREIREQHPPVTLPIWRKVSPNSVLKSYSRARNDEDQDDCETLKRAEGYFAKQCSEIARAEWRDKVLIGLNKNKGVIGVTFFVGISAVALGVYLGKRGVDTKAV